MRKLFSYVMLMAVGLLISGNAGAVNQENGHATENVGVDVAKMDVNKGGVVTTTFYATLQEAFDDVPDNSYPATITILKNTVSSITKNKALVLGEHQNVTLDLNGFEVVANSIHDKGTALIENNGTLIIEDNSIQKTGKLFNVAADPDVTWAEGTDHPWPSWANNLITNYGTVIINGGYLENGTNDNNGAACYVVDNISNKRDVKLEINGGTLMKKSSVAIRLYAQSTTYNNDVIINDGLVWSYAVIEIQLPSHVAGRANLTINGGEIRSYAYTYVACRDFMTPAAGGGDIYPWGNDDEDYSNVTMTINGGIINNNWKPKYEKVNWTISGGTFNSYIFYPEEGGFITSGYFYVYKKYWKPTFLYKPAAGTCSSITGDALPSGWQSWTTVKDWEDAGYKVGTYNIGIDDIERWYICQLTEGSSNTNSFRYYYDDELYTEKPIEENDEYTLVQIVPKTNKEVVTPDEESKTITWTGNSEGSGQTNPVETDVVTIKNTNTEEGKNTTIVVDGNVKVNQITVTKEEGSKGEAQIVVKEGATLNVGNGGIVSENDVLTTVLVESGGTLIVGTNGIDKQGEATPIKIQASEGKGTGALIFSPNATATATQKYAEVDLYTYCKNVGGKDYWQQFAVPVTKVANPTTGYKFVTTNVSPMTTYLFDWDYSQYAWRQLSNWGDEAFAGYDMTNTSTNGGVVYTFKGDLIGNQNIQLTLPHKDYCVMGNSYTAPISIDALFEQIEKEMAAATIEQTVYKYNAMKGYYEYTNKLAQFFDKMGVMEASFTEIKPMEGFLLNLQSGNTAGVMLNYANAVFTPATKSTAPASAPARQAATTDMTIAKITINSANYTDCMTLVEGDEFSADIENGKDAYKYINEDGINLYAFNDNVKLAMLASDNIEGTNIAFQSAADDEYTLTFQNVINNEYELLDLQTNIRIPMIEGNAYTFTATPNTLNPSRFMLVASRATPTGTEKVKGIKQVKGIYTMLGQYMGAAEAWSSLPAGVYVVNGVQMAK